MPPFSTLSWHRYYYIDNRFIQISVAYKVNFVSPLASQEAVDGMNRSVWNNKPNNKNTFLNQKFKQNTKYSFSNNPRKTSQKETFRE